jgi:cytochrome c peroxidase
LNLLHRPHRTLEPPATIGLGCLAAVALLALSASGCNRDPLAASAPVAPSAVVAEAVTPLPRDLNVNPAKVDLGNRLFHDRRLSRTGQVACASCHNLQTAGVDGQRVSRGVDNRTGTRNAPTVFNAALNFRQFWDGRAATLEDQAAGPLLNPIEMGSTWPQILDVLTNDADYVRDFDAAYRDGITATNVLNAIAAFERTLLTPDAPFDAYLRGEPSALSPAAQAGWRLFRTRGCIACHQGVNLGGNLYHNFGVMGDFLGDKSRASDTDQGRYHITGRPEDRHLFKVPSLRNVARTAPYFHDGSTPTLPEAVRVMARFQLGIDLTQAETGQIVAFLESLTGRYQGRPL